MRYKCTRVFKGEEISIGENSNSVQVEGTELSKWLKFSCSALPLSDTTSFVFRDWHLGATTTGARASIIITHLASEASN